MNPADYAWITLIGAVLAYEVAAALHPKGELLSEAADRYRAGRPIATHAAVIYLAGHLLRRWPERLDPLHRLAHWLGSR